MTQVSYKSLDKLVRNLILSTIGAEDIDLIESQGRAGSASGDSTVDRGITGLVDALVGDLRQMVPPRILNGLTLAAFEPANDQITIGSGAGFANGRKYVLNRTVVQLVPFEDDISVYYINLWQGKIDIETIVPEEKLNIGKIIIPSPGITNKIQDDKDFLNEENVDNGYLVSAKDLFFDDDVLLDDDSKQVLKDALGTINFAQLSGDLILTENIRVRNASNTLTIDSNSIKILFQDSENVSALFNAQGTFYFDEAGNELSRYTKNDTRIGNIRLLPNAIQSTNFLENLSGFRIQDNGDAEFNNVRLRGSLFTSTIEENIFIAEGVTFIGDLIFNDDVCLKVDKHLIFDCDQNSDSYMTYNSTSNYLEVWVDGSKRVEM